MKWNENEKKNNNQRNKRNEKKYKYLSQMVTYLICDKLGYRFKSAYEQS